MKFHYASGAMGYHGEGWFWHRFYNFPKLPFITKTLTINPINGNPWAVLPLGKSVFNKVALHNCGFYKWLYSRNTQPNCTISFHGTDIELDVLVGVVQRMNWLDAIELNFSCPNAKNEHNIKIPESKLPIYIKLNHKQNPFDYDLDRVAGIRVNSIPMKYGGGSGKIAQKDNWAFIERYIKEGFNVSGCSFTSFDDIRRLEDMGCTEISIGSVIITNPKLVEKITTYEY